jgi:predicted Zn-ribbon and HTH transcriptional regulator
MWKPGQIVTIRGKRYRITKAEDKYENYICIFCAFRQEKKRILYPHPCKECGYEGRVPINCYLKQINPKSQEG